MADDKIEHGLNTIQTTVRINCLCEKEINWMEVVRGSSGSGKATNAVMGWGLECPACHRQVGVEVIVQAVNVE